MNYLEKWFIETASDVNCRFCKNTEFLFCGYEAVKLCFCQSQIISYVDVPCLLKVQNVRVYESFIFRMFYKSIFDGILEQNFALVTQCTLNTNKQGLQTVIHIMLVNYIFDTID